MKKQLDIEDMRYNLELAHGVLSLRAAEAEHRADEELTDDSVESFARFCYWKGRAEGLREALDAVLSKLI